MTLAYYLESAGLDVKDIKFMQSQKSAYDGSTTKIAWISFPAPQSELDNQDFLVLSKSLCEDILAKKLKLSEACVAESDEGWGLIRPQSGNLLDLTDLW